MVVGNYRSEGRGAHLALGAALYCVALRVYAVWVATVVRDITLDTQFNLLLALLAVLFIVAMVAVLTTTVPRPIELHVKRARKSLRRKARPDEMKG